MLHVRLDWCAERDGVTLFEQVPLTGVGAEVGSEYVSADGAPAGIVRLWEFREGRLVGPWTEPLLRSDQSIMVDEDADQRKISSHEAVMRHGPGYDGTVVTFHGPRIYRMEGTANDGLDIAAINWDGDFRIQELEFSRVIETGDGAVVVGHAVQCDTAGGRGIGDDGAAIRTILSVVTGEIVPSAPDRRRFDLNRMGTARFKPRHPREASCHSSSLEVGLDGDGNIDRLVLSSAEHFGFLRSVAADVILLAWHPLSLGQLAERPIGPDLYFRMDMDAAEQVVDAFGGFAAFDQVERLRLLAFGWDLMRISGFLALPNLVDVDLIEAPGTQRGVPLGRRKVRIDHDGQRRIVTIE